MRLHFLERMMFLTFAFVLGTASAHAHHVMGGKTPSSFIDGLLSGLGHPLIGDQLYGRARRPPRAKTDAEAKAYTASVGFPRQALHAWLIGFQHPSTHRHLRFESPWPEDFAELIAALRGLNTRP